MGIRYYGNTGEGYTLKFDIVKYVSSSRGWVKVEVLVTLRSINTARHYIKAMSMIEVKPYTYGIEKRGRKSNG